jgi:hypothetical protein
MNVFILAERNLATRAMFGGVIMVKKALHPATRRDARGVSRNVSIADRHLGKDIGDLLARRALFIDKRATSNLGLLAAAATRAIFCRVPADGNRQIRHARQLAAH